MKLVTWLIQYSDGSIQEADAFNKVDAAKQAIHGAGIMLVTRKQIKQAETRG